MAEHHDGEQPCRRGSIPAGGNAANHHDEVEPRKGQRDGEGKLLRPGGPEPGRGDCKHPRCHDIPNGPAGAVDHQDDQRRPERENGWDDVAEHHDGEQPRSERPVPARVNAANDHPEVDQRKGQRDGEGELPRHGRGDVAAVDRERPIEEEEGRGNRHQRRTGERQTNQTPEQIGSKRQRHQPRHGDQLERHAIGKEDIEGDDRQRGEHHVELIGRKACVPVGCPATQTAMRNEVVPQKCRPPDVCAHVAARWGGVGQHQVRVEGQHDEQHRPRNDQRAESSLRGRNEPAGKSCRQARLRQW